MQSDQSRRRRGVQAGGSPPSGAVDRVRRRAARGDGGEVLCDRRQRRPAGPARLARRLRRASTSSTVRRGSSRSRACTRWPTAGTATRPPGTRPARPTRRPWRPPREGRRRPRRLHRCHLQHARAAVRLHARRLPEVGLVHRPAHADRRRRRAAVRAAGSTAVRNVVEKYQPLLLLTGHIHESRGLVKVGRTTGDQPRQYEYGEGILRGCIVSLAPGKVVGYQMTSG